MTRPYTTSRITWCGIAIAIRYCPDWLPSYCGIYGHPLAHLEIETVDPPRAPLPVTNTGYRSHFTAPSIIEAEGGPAAFARAWLDHEAEKPEWKARAEAARQMSLF